MLPYVVHYCRSTIVKHEQGGDRDFHTCMQAKEELQRKLREVQQDSKAGKQSLHQLQEKLDKQQKEVDKLEGELLQVPL